MAYVEENIGSLEQQLGKLFEKSLGVVVPKETDIKPWITACHPRYGDYSCSNAMILWSRMKAKGTKFEFEGPRSLGQALINNLPASGMVESFSISGCGLVNIVLSKQWMAKRIQKMLMDGIGSWAPKFPVGRVAIDLSSSNLVKEMHVGNLRSITVGDTLARMLEFSGVEVLRRDHIGDWGTQGESFHSPYIAMVLELLSEKGLIQESEGARVIFAEGKDVPLLVVRRDGGFDYALTVLTDLWYLLNKEKAEWIIYVTDVGQNAHFDMAFTAAKRAGWLPTENYIYPRASHVGFSLKEDVKPLRSHSNEVVQLVDLLDEAKTHCRDAIIERGLVNELTEEELERTAEAVGHSAVKYAVLRNNISTSCTFNFGQILNFKGNTAVYLIDAHSRICSIIRSSGKDMEELKKVGKIELTRDAERVLAIHLLQFAETVKGACINLLPDMLCRYLYGLSEEFTRFCTTCQVIGSAEETSRLLLCEATAVVMRKCFHLLGITPIYKI